VDANNVAPLLIQYRAYAIESGNGFQRKAILPPLAHALLERITALRDRQKLADLAQVLLGQVRSGHLQVYLNDTQAQGSLQKLNLDGAVRPGSADYVILVDSNLGFSKMDLYVERKLAYHVDLSDPGKPLASLKVSYRLPQTGSEPCHQGINPAASSVDGGYYTVRCYWDYWRLLLAPSTRLLNARFDPVPSSYFDDGVGWKNAVEAGPGENGTQQLAGLLVLPPGGQTKEVTLDVQLPAAVIELSGNRLVYRLRIQKQAGIVALPLEISIKPPKGYQLASIPTAWAYDPTRQSVTWLGELQAIQDFQLVFERKN
jgi:hypothetical protein